MLDRVDLDKNEIGWVCGCGNDNVTRIEDLRLGSGEDPNNIDLPVCACGVRTVLIRTWEPDVDFPHRRAINALAEELIARGQSSAAFRAVHDAEEDVPPLMTDLSKVDDLLGRKAEAERLAAAEAFRVQWEAEAPAREAAIAAAEAEAAAAEEERLFLLAEAARLERASANVNKRLGLPPGAEPPADELAVELAKSALEISPPEADLPPEPEQMVLL